MGCSKHMCTHKIEMLLLAETFLLQTVIIDEQMKYEKKLSIIGQTINLFSLNVTGFVCVILVSLTSPSLLCLRYLLTMILLHSLSPVLLDFILYILSAPNLSFCLYYSVTCIQFPLIALCSKAEYLPFCGIQLLQFINWDSI